MYPLIASVCVYAYLCACAFGEPGQSSPLRAWALLASLRSLWACGSEGGQREGERKEEKEPKEGEERSKEA